MLITCNRCGKTLDIVNDGDGIHTCTPKQAKADYPWPMDMPIDNEMIHDMALRFGSALPYLIDRLKIAEAPGVFTMRVNEALAELADRGLPGCATYCGHLSETTQRRRNGSPNSKRRSKR